MRRVNMITSVFGIPVKYETWDKQNALPLYITGNYEFYTAYIANMRCIILSPAEELTTLPALKKTDKKNPERR